MDFCVRTGTFWAVVCSLFWPKPPANSYFGGVVKSRWWAFWRGSKTKQLGSMRRGECSKVHTNSLLVGHDGQIYCKEVIEGAKRECKILRLWSERPAEVRLVEVGVEEDESKT